MVMGVLKRRFCVDMKGKGIYLFLVGLWFDACVLFCAADLRWVCAQYFVIVSYNEVLRDNICMYVAHICFYVCCSDSAGVCGDVCGVSVVVKGCGSL